MRRTQKGTSFLLVAAMLLSLCATASCYGRRPSTEATIGAVGGAAAGGLLGAALGDGEAIAAGAILGGLLGAGVGEYLSQRDRRYMADTTYAALEKAPTGDSREWNNPDTGHSGQVTPVETYQTAQGTNCRDFRQTVRIEGEPRSSYGTACRQPNGSWRIIR